ncbi:MAG: phasin, partial [Roseiarcus sp.]
MTKSITKTKAAAELLKPVVGALEKGKSKIEVPEVARNFVIRTAETVKERAASVNARAQKATAAFETAATDSIAGVVKASRSV